MSAHRDAFDWDWEAAARAEELRLDIAHEASFAPSTAREIQRSLDLDDCPSCDVLRLAGLHCPNCGAPLCSADRACVARAHDRNCPTAIAEELTELRKRRRDHCDGCGKQTTVTDVWIDGTPTTLCQPCVLAALTAEGEHLGNYFGWDIE